MAALSTSVKVELIACLSEQLSELELFKSMYPNTDEICEINNTVIEEINNFINHGTDCIPPHLDFVLNIFVNNLKLEICINLPSFYPNDEPDISIRCNQLNRKQESKLNLQLFNYIKEIPRGDTCLYTIVSWIQDNANIVDDQQSVNTITSVNDSKSTENFARYWIYSHHIYNKRKRDDIVSYAKDLNLNGFCLPGKPGIVCIEGEESNCKEWWKIIKSMCWKKITLRKIELFKWEEKEFVQKFNKFEEIHFPNSGHLNTKHMDMSSFLKYLNELKLSDPVNDFFGICKDD